MQLPPLRRAGLRVTRTSDGRVLAAANYPEAESSVNVQVGTQFAGLVALVGLVSAVLTLIVHVGLALGVWRDAHALRARGTAPFLIGPDLWAIATLLGGVFVATAYWIVHHSALRPGVQSKAGVEERGGLE